MGENEEFVTLNSYYEPLDINIMYKEKPFLVAFFLLFFL